VTLRQLESFLAVARARSFRKAAGTLALSQPALSQQIKELERELGLAIFDRLGRTVQLTQAGRLLEEHAPRIFAALEGAQEAIRELSGLRRGSVLLGGSTTPGIYLLPWLLGEFKNRYPEVDVSLRIANTRQIEELIRTGELDLGIVGGHLANTKETCVEASLEDTIVLIVPPGHRWARRRPIAPELLQEECLLTREEGSATRRVIEAALARGGVMLRACLELGHTEAIKQGVRAGLGVALVSRHAVRSELESGQLLGVALRGLSIRRHFHVIRHEAKSLSPTARAFLEFLREHRALRGPRAPIRGREPALASPSGRARPR
jgi:DNA-binding transcriptional LysR family regulator